MANKAKVVSQPAPMTNGAEIGARLRARANTLTGAQREAARLRGAHLLMPRADQEVVETKRHRSG